MVENAKTGINELKQQDTQRERERMVENAKTGINELKQQDTQRERENGRKCQDRN